MVVAGIVAGGIGSRMGMNRIPKQFMLLSDKPIIIHTIEKFLICPEINYVVVGVHQEWLSYAEDLQKKYLSDYNRVVFTCGDNNRNGTIKKIVDKAVELWDITNDTVFVTHDAVRPFVSLKIIHHNIQAAQEFGVCDTVCKATDTIIQSDNERFITDIPIRSHMYQGQTPQSFRYDLFMDVYESMTEEELGVVTDACKMFYLRGHNVSLVEGDVINFKITYPFDLKMAKMMTGDVEND
ncbi:MAG: IspD/TarI family cytidylyltransferase [Lachnospiraceae bacterium]